MKAVHFNLDKVFAVSVVLKGLDAALELVSGLFLLIVSPHFINHIVTVLTHHELQTDPHDYIATLIAHAGHNLANNSRVFGGLYLLLHGLVKLAVVVGVLKQWLWAYPAMIVVLLGFIAYQIYSIAHKFSLGLLLLSAFDAFIVVLAWFEWQKHKQRLAKEQEHAETE